MAELASKVSPVSAGSWRVCGRPWALRLCCQASRLCAEAPAEARMAASSLTLWGFPVARRTGERRVFTGDCCRDVCVRGIAHARVGGPR